MVATTPNFRTLGDALADSAPLLRGEGASLMGAMEHNPGIMRQLRNAALRADPIIDATLINGATNGVPDDTAQQVGGRIANRLNPERELDALKNGFVPNQMADEAALKNKVRPPVKRKTPVNEPKPSALDKGMEYLSDGLGKAAMVPVATAFVLPMVGGLAGKAQFHGVEKMLKAPGEFLDNKQLMKGVTLHQALNDGVQLGFSAIQSYGVAKGFSQQMASLKQMYADVTGVDPRTVSTMTILTGKMPPALVEARSHFIKEFGSRGLIQAVGWGLIARDLIRSKGKSAAEIGNQRIGIAAGIVPGIVGIGVDALMGTSTVEVYSGFKKAFESGENIPAGAYAQFILASSPDLQKRKVGKQVALEIGTEYANEKAAPGEILKQMNDGRFQARIEKLIAKDEAALAAKQQANAAAGAAGATMVDKINGNRQNPGKVVGPFTDRLHKESAMQNKELH